MSIKITGKNAEQLELNTAAVLNICTVIAAHGAIPTPGDIVSSSQLGRFWWREENKYHLFSIVNDWWAFVIYEDETTRILNIRYRYDHKNAADAICKMLAARFDFIELLEEN